MGKSRKEKRNASLRRHFDHSTHRLKLLQVYAPFQRDNDILHAYFAKITADLQNKKKATLFRGRCAQFEQKWRVLVRVIAIGDFPADVRFEDDLYPMAPAGLTEAQFFDYAQRLKKHPGRYVVVDTWMPLDMSTSFLEHLYPSKRGRGQRLYPPKLDQGYGVKGDLKIVETDPKSPSEYSDLLRELDPEFAKFCGYANSKTGEPIHPKRGDPDADKELWRSERRDLRRYHSNLLKILGPFEDFNFPKRKPRP